MNEGKPGLPCEGSWFVVVVVMTATLRVQGESRRWRVAMGCEGRNHALGTKPGIPVQREERTSDRRGCGCRPRGHLGDALRTELKGDIDALQTELKGGIDALRTELAVLRRDIKDEFAVHRTETRDDTATLRTEIAALRTECREDFGALRIEITGLRTDTRTDIAALRGDIRTGLVGQRTSSVA